MFSPKLCYCMLTDSFNWTSVGLCLYLTDKPESDHQLNVLGYGGTTSKLFGLVTYFKPTTQPPWNLCFNSRVQYCQKGQLIHQYNNCNGWNIDEYQKHLNTVQYCMDIQMHKCLPLFLHCIRPWMNNILFLIDHHLNGFQMVWS